MTPRSLRERCLKEFLGVVSWWAAVMLFILSDFVWSHISYRKTTCTAIFSVAFHFTINQPKKNDSEHKSLTVIPAFTTH